MTRCNNAALRALALCVCVTLAGVLAACAGTNSPNSSAAAQLPVIAPQMTSAHISAAGLNEPLTPPGNGNASHTPHIFVANPPAGEVTSYDLDGTLTGRIFQGYRPLSVAVNPSDTKVYVTDNASNVVTTYTVNGTRTTPIITDGPHGTGSVAVDKNGKIYVADFTGNTIRTYTPNGARTTPTITQGLHGPASVAIDEATGKIYVANFSNDTVTIYTSNGMRTNPTITQGISGPRAIAVDSGRVYVANFKTNANNNVTTYTTNGTRTAPTITKGHKRTLRCRGGPSGQNLRLQHRTRQHHHVHREWNGNYSHDHHGPDASPGSNGSLEPTLAFGLALRQAQGDNRGALMKYSDRMMYTPGAFVGDFSEAVRLIAEEPFGMLVSAGDGDPTITHLPFSIVRSSSNLLLCAHMAKANPHWHQLDGAKVVIVFRGVHGYISPQWYTDPQDDVPTWNYKVVHCVGTASIAPDRDKEAILARLIDEMEAASAAPWSLRTMQTARLESLKKGIIAFYVHVDKAVAKFKLSQNRTAADRDGAIEGLRESTRLEDHRLAAEMERLAGSPAAHPEENNFPTNKV